MAACRIASFLSSAVFGGLLAAAGLAEEVLLTPVGGDQALVVELISYDEARYLVRLATGAAPQSLPRASYLCSGAACPPANQEADQPVDQAGAPIYGERRPADLIMVGSDSVGEDLMPLIVGPFATLLGGTAEEPVMVSPTMAQYSIRDAAGAELLLLEIDSTSSGPGIAALIAGEAQVAMSSRAAEPEEVAALRAQGRGELLDISQEYIVAVDSVLIIVHPDNPVSTLSRRQLREIFAGRITNWSEVGGPDLPIVVVARPDGSARANFESWAFDGPPERAPDAILIDGGAALTRQVLSEPGAIGYSISDNVLEAKPLNLLLDCGIRMNATTFKTKAEEYLLGRRIRLYTDNGPRSEALQTLLRFMISPQADSIVAESGYIDLGIESDPDALARLIEAASAEGQSTARERAIAEMAEALQGASRLSLTFRFQSSSWRLDNKALRDLGRLVDYLSRPENADKQVIFVGFADAVGGYGLNQTLSRVRAEAVLDKVRFYLTAAPLRGRNMIATGFGELAPMGCNDTPEGRSRNRRVEVWLR